MTKHKLRSIPKPDISFASATGLPAVYLRDAHKSFGENEVLCGLSLTINKGEVVSIIGPSGSGKTTLLRCLTLLDTFDGGELAYGDVRVCTLDSERYSKYDPEAMAKARMRFGIVFQDYNLFPHYSVLKNVMDAPVVVQKRDPNEVETAARELLDRLDLAEHADKVPCQLSGGQQQRVAIARALCMNPRVIYFDEATSALDPKLTKDMHRLIRELATDGMAVGIVTHEMGFARDVSDRICLLYDGQIIEEGTPDEVINHPKNELTKEFLSHVED
jgi:polar amino acid transport system ATP-binding protein